MTEGDTNNDLTDWDRFCLRGVRERTGKITGEVDPSGVVIVRTLGEQRLAATPDEAQQINSQRATHPFTSAVRRIKKTLRGE